jgi:hypothetical protein
MTYRILAFLVLVGCTTACRDSADQLSRDYRNLNNEAIDALMMITDEPQAKLMLERVIREYPQKLKVVDDRCKNWKQNTEKDEYATQIFTSDSMAILLVECKMNQERLELEKRRLKRLNDQLVADEREARRQAGDPNAIVEPRTLFPTISLLLSDEKDDLKRIETQLEKGGEVIGVLREIEKDERLLKSKKISDLKDAFQSKVDTFMKDRIIELKVN